MEKLCHHFSATPNGQYLATGDLLSEEMMATSQLVGKLNACICRFLVKQAWSLHNVYASALLICKASMAYSGHGAFYSTHCTL